MTMRSQLEPTPIMAMKLPVPVLPTPILPVDPEVEEASAMSMVPPGTSFILLVTSSRIWASDRLAIFWKSSFSSTITLALST